MGQLGRCGLLFKNMGDFISPLPQTDPQNHTKNQALTQIATQLCLAPSQIHKLYRCFTRMQIKPQAYLTLDDMANSIHDGYEHFSQLPYLERLFTLIAKQTPDKVFFEDYLTGISSFCLLNSESVLRFVFDWLDTDGDERITKDNILTAAQYAHPKNKKSTFFVNFVPELDLELKDGQKLMTFNEFNTLCNKMPFLIWPAYSLQQKLRALNLGESFWQTQYAKIDKAQALQKNTQKKASRIQKRVQDLQSIKLNIYSDEPSLKQRIHIRQQGRCVTDLQLIEAPLLQRRRSCPHIKIKLDFREGAQGESL